MVNLALLEPGRYVADGSYGFSETGLRLPFESSFSVEQLPLYLLIEGKARQPGGRQAYRFRVRLDRDTNSQSQADASVSISGVPELRGRASLVGPTRELLAFDPANENQLSARVVPLDKPRIYEISGLLGLTGKGWFPFHFRVVPTEARAALENVIALPKRTA